MWRTNLKVAFVGLLVIGFYTSIAHIIPQLRSEVPIELDLSAGFTADALVSAGRELYEGAGGCTACHGLGTRAPSLLADYAGEGSIGNRCGLRPGGLDCKAYLYQSLTEPEAVVVAGFSPIMPDARRQLSVEQIWALVAFLQSQGGEVTVTADDIPAQGSAPATPATGGGQPPTFSQESDPRQLLNDNACIGCHVLDGTGGPVGPAFDGIGQRLDAAAIRKAILEPNADVSPGYQQMAGVMPTTFGSQLSAQQLETIVTFLAGRQ
ncbi:MAG: c-type cytochrome [Gemmatimonadetes bacterium]|nr:c-type cytochrome [Gemmatimonadota bacterium]